VEVATAVTPASKADSTIELGVEFKTCACCTTLSSVTLALFPDVITRQVSVVASVTDDAGRVLGVFGSTGKSKRVVQLRLVWVLPLTLPFVPLVEQTMWNHTFRDIFILAGEAIAEDQLARPSRGSVTSARLERGGRRHRLQIRQARVAAFQTRDAGARSIR